MIKEQIKISVQNALEVLNIEYQNIIIQEPRNHKDVDYATNIALMVSKQLTMNPMDAAEKIVEGFTNQMNPDYVELPQQDIDDIIEFIKSLKEE